MKKRIWQLLVVLVFIIVVSSFLILFSEKKTEPAILNMPYIFWVGILQTTLLVILTFLGAKFFPFKSDHEI